MPCAGVSGRPARSAACAQEDFPSSAPPFARPPSRGRKTPGSSRPCRRAENSRARNQSFQGLAANYPGARQIPSFASRSGPAGRRSKSSRGSRPPALRSPVRPTDRPERTVNHNPARLARKGCGILAASRPIGGPSLPLRRMRKSGTLGLIDRREDVGRSKNPEARTRRAASLGLPKQPARSNT